MFISALMYALGLALGIGLQIAFIWFGAKEMGLGKALKIYLTLVILVMLTWAGWQILLGDVVVV